MDVLTFLLTLAFALVFGYVGLKLKLPAGPLVGGIVGTAAMNLLIGRAVFYSDIRIVVQMLSGAMIGCNVGKRDFLEMKGIILPTIFLLFSMFLLNITFGSLIYRFSNLDMATALFATAPGGVSDMALISEDLGANTSYVGILQMYRILVVFIFMPPLFQKIFSRINRRPVQVQAVGFVEESAQNEAPQSEEVPKSRGRLLWLLLAAAAGGILFRLLGVAAGALTGAMVAAAAYSILCGKVPFPSKLQFFIQVFAGAFIGIGIDRARVATLPQLLIPMLVMFVGIFVFTFATAFLMRKIFKLDLAVCLLSSTPGGVQEMALLSEDLHADTPKVAVMHTARLMCVILLFPTMLGVIAAFAGG
ncbi:MAG: AbrB family transcriptional regulator [Christensenellales bacterium]